MNPLARALAISVITLTFSASAAPFAEWFFGTSPNGVRVRVWGEGDEYSIRYEAEDGHAVVKDATTRTYFYARQEQDGALVSTGIAVGDETDADRAVLAAIPLHQRDTSAAAREAREKRIRKFDGETDRAARWAKLKETTRKVREARTSGLLMAPPANPTVGMVKGLTVLIDFPGEDSSRTTWETVHPGVTVDKLDELLNGDNCTLYGNVSSVRSYYHDASNGRLDYSMVLIGPITAPEPRSHYDDTSRDNGDCARELIGDVFNVIWNDANFTTKYLPLLQSLSAQDGKVRSLNFWFAGESGSAWSYGLWAHKWSVGSDISGRYTFKDVSGKTVQFADYQITPITSTPGIYTFCHENGHMLCGFPDLYNYESSISGNRGVGYFSLMFGSADKQNPPYFDAYLRAAAGWVEPQLLPSAGGTVTVRANHTDVWKYENPSNPKEYYLIENRQQKGRDASIKASGVLIWRCNEDGNNCHPNPTTYLSGFDSGVYRWNYELSLEQADGDYDLEQGANSGDSYDTWYKGNSLYDDNGVFSDDSIPTAKWRDASDSGLNLSNFSSNGDTMTFDVAAYSGAAATVPLATALDNSELEFSTSAKASWFGQTSKAKVGGSAAKSAAIGNSQDTWMQTVVTGPGTLAFDWLVSSEKDYDFLELAIDGTVQDKISGSSGWDAESCSILEGLHVVRWTYRKDWSTSSGDDAGYVDHVVWTPDPKVAKPVISGPSGADFVPPAAVSISCATEGATIRYTLDGTDPTETSAVYTQPVVIEGNAKIRARAFKGGLAPSEIASAAYFKRRTPNDVFGTEGIEWTNESTVPWHEEGSAMRTGGIGEQYTSTLKAVVRGKGRLTFSYKACSYSGNNKFTFSLNGSQKLNKYYTESAGTDFAGTETYEITDDKGATFQWVYKVGSTRSDKSCYDYSYCGVWLSDVVWEPAESAATPVIAGDEVALIDGYRDVAVSCATTGATIRYTLDGSDPTESSAVLSGGSIRMTDDATLKVRAYKDGMGASAVASARYLKKASPGAWTTDAERVRLSAAVDGRMICVARLNENLEKWAIVGPILNDARFLSWTAANGIYLVKWDSKADSSGTSASAVWYKKLYKQSGKTADVNWEMCFARPDSPDTFAGYARAYDGCYIGSVKYDKTVPGMIAGFASIVFDNGLTPTPVFAASEIASFLQTSGIMWSNGSPLSWRDETADEINKLRAGGFTNTAYASTLSATVKGPGALTFTYRAVSSSSSNKFLFKMNGDTVLDKCSAGSTTTHSGTETVEVTAAGGAAFDWVYTVGSPGDEKSTSGVWISDVVWTPVSPRVTVAGTVYETLAEAISYANSRTPLVFESTPTIDGVARTITTAAGETVQVADIYDLRLDGKTVYLSLVDAIGNPPAQPFTRVTWTAGRKTSVLVPAFTADADGDGVPALSVLTRRDFWYALGFITDGGETIEASGWVAGDGTPQQLKAGQPSGGAYGRDRYRILVSEVDPDIENEVSETPKEFALDGAKPVTVSVAPGQGKIAGEEEPPLDIVTDGLDDSDPATFVWKAWRDPGETNGTYAVHLAPEQIPEPCNYTFSYNEENGFTIESLLGVEAPTAVAGLVYNGAAQTGVADGEGYTLTGNVATNAGEHTAVATLADGCCWADDGSVTNRFLAWTIVRKTVTVTPDAKQSKTKDAAYVITYMSDPATLFGTDAFVGALAIGDEHVGECEIVQGTLAIDDGKDGGNYELVFTTGVKISVKAATVGFSVVSGNKANYYVTVAGQQQAGVPSVLEVGAEFSVVVSAIEHYTYAGVEAEGWTYDSVADTLTFSGTAGASAIALTVPDPVAKVFHVEYYVNDLEGEPIRVDPFTIANYMTDLHIWDGVREDYNFDHYEREDGTSLDASDKALRDYITEEAEAAGCDGVLKVIGFWTEKTVLDRLIDAVEPGEFHDTVVGKIEAIAGGDTPQVEPQTLADWIADRGVTSAALAASDYIVASVNLGAGKPITETTEVEFAEVGADAADGFTFRIELTFEDDPAPEVVRAASERVAGCIQAVDDLTGSFGALDSSRVAVDSQTGLVTIRPTDPPKPAEFFRIVLARDPKREER